MKGGVVFAICFVSLMIFGVQLAAAGIEEEINKITYYAESYETGNINYAQLMVYMAAARNDIEGVLHTSGDRKPLDETQLKAVLGEPTETTGWAWSNKEQKEKKIGKDAPGWRKVIFDGKKLQIMLEAWPQIAEKDNEQVLYYGLHFSTRFKEPDEGENLDLNVDEITSLAEKFKIDSSDDNANALVDAIIEAEKPVQSYLQENSQKCENILNKLIGSSYRRDSRETIVREIKIYQGDDFESQARLEFCEDCDWTWINFDIHSWERNNFGNDEVRETDFERYRDYSSDKFKEAIREAVEEYRNANNIQEAYSIERKIRELHNSWMQSTNDVHEEVEKAMQERRQEITSPEDIEKYDFEDSRRDFEQIAKDLQKKRAEEIKDFYTQLFSSYEQREYRYTQIDYERRLVEQFESAGEMCSNKIDDNSNGEIDCADSFCAGQVCGSAIVKEKRGEEEVDVARDMFCIERECKLEEAPLEKEPICGNNICEDNEIESCSQDCTQCPEHEPIACEGNVIFKGKDDKGCPLEPICIQQATTCSVDSDCSQPLCGSASCVEGECKTVQLTECREEECVTGEREVTGCISGEELVVKLCVDGLWEDTGQQCAAGEHEQAETEEQAETYDECSARSDCGGENDVCSNGQCVVLPEVITEDIEEIVEEIVQESPAEETEETETLTGNFILGIKKFTGFVLNGFDTNEGNTGETESTEGTTQENSSGENIIPENVQTSPEEPVIEENNQEEQENEEEERREENQPQPESRQAGVFSLFGMCRVSKERSEGFASYNGWGNPFEKIQRLKEKSFRHGNSDWCKRELASSLIQRKELESSLNEEFAKWFFEDYLANSADEWEKRSSGIYEIYWRDIELSQRIAESAKCAGMEIDEFNLINFEYDTEYGRIKFWEEIKKAEIPRANGEVNLVSPYMTIWIFPSKEFLVSEFRKAMENEKFPGPRESIEDEHEGLLEEKDKEQIKSDEKLIGKLTDFIDKYGEQDKAVISAQLVDYTNNNVVLNLYVLLDKENIIQVKPILQEKMPKENIKVEVDFDKFYSMMEGIQKDVKDDRTERPPWDKSSGPAEGFNNVKNGVKVWLKVQGVINSAKVTPASAESDIKGLIKTFMWEGFKHAGDENQPDDELLEEQASEDNLAAISGQVIRGLSY